MGTPDTTRQLAQDLTDRLQGLGRPLTEIAVEIGMPRTTLQRRLRDGEFTVTQLDAIADLLGTSSLVLLGGAA